MVAVFDFVSDRSYLIRCDLESDDSMIKRYLSLALTSQFEFPHREIASGDISRHCARYRLPTYQVDHRASVIAPNSRIEMDVVYILF